MNLVTLIPIAKGIPRDEISYFSAREIQLGTLVTVPFGKRTIQGVVIDIHPVRDAKSFIKQSSFTLRNITEIHNHLILPREIFLAAQDTARWYAQPIGPLLKTMLPEKLFDVFLHHPPTQLFHKPPFRTCVSIQASREDRIATYKTTIRENLARKMSTLIVVPSRIHGESLVQALEQGLEHKLLFIHGQQTPTALSKNLELIFSSPEPLVVITTPAFASILRNDWATVIFERSSSPHYRYTFGPVFDMRYYLEQLFARIGCTIVFGDHLLDPGIRMRIAQREITEIRSVMRIAQPPRLEILDMKPHKQPVPPSREKVVVADELEIHHPAEPYFHASTRELLDGLNNQSPSFILLTTRTGLAPLTVCRDCGTTVTCRHCGSPLVLHRKSNTSSDHPARVYMCHTCLMNTEPLDHCVQCSGWRLVPLGMGSDRIKEVLEEHYPHLTSFIADGDHTTTLRQVQKIITTWQQHPGSVLIATPFIIPYLPPCEIGCIVSSDSLLSLPTYTGSEYALGSMMSFLEKVTQHAIIQTRLPDHEILETLRNGSLQDFLETSLALRQQFHYPPFVALIKITFEVPHAEVRDAQSYSEEVFKKWNPDILIKKSPLPDTFLVQTILRIPYDAWRDPQHPLHEHLRVLGKEVTIEVDSERIV
jgi:primosomal protein N'